MFEGILQKFAEGSPVAVMVYGLCRNILNAEKIDQWFEANGHGQYTRKIRFSWLVVVMLEVVCQIHTSVLAAFRDKGSRVVATVVAVYDKLKGIDPKTSQGLVRYTAETAGEIIDEMGGTKEPLLPGYRVRFLDGNCIEASEHRLGVLRETKAGALPGKSLVVFDPDSGLCGDVFPCEDGHAQERSLLGEVAETVQAGEVWVADRNFCVSHFLWEIAERQAYFVIRQHQSLPCEPVTELAHVVSTEGGEIYEQKIKLTGIRGEELEVRRIEIHLKQATRDGDRVLSILTNIPAEEVNALGIAEVYRKRWGIETAFQKLEKYLHSEINTLGYPKAALFGFCIALIAYNIYAIVMAALRVAHPNNNIDDEVSEYYIGDEIRTKTEGMLIALAEEDWRIFMSATPIEMAKLLIYLASQADLVRFKKQKRGPKKPKERKERYPGKPHVSTARLLAAACA